jgi:hypothetical protein
MNSGWLKTASILTALLLAVGGIAIADNDYGGGYYDTTINLLVTDFEGGFPPTGWEVVSNSESTWQSVGHNQVDSFVPQGQRSPLVQGQPSLPSDEWLISPVLNGSECNSGDLEVEMFVWLGQLSDKELFDLSFNIRNEADQKQDWSFRGSLDELVDSAGWDSIFFESARFSGENRIGFRFFVTGDGDELAETFMTAIENIRITCTKEEYWPDDNYDDDDNNNNNGKASACFCGASNGKPGPYLFVVMLLIGFLAMLSSVRGRKN